MRIVVAESESAFARDFADAVHDVVRERPAARIGLPSGRTPIAGYRELHARVSEAAVEFGRARAFAVDELHGVPRDHPATNASYFQRYPGGALEVAVMDSEAADGDAECERFARAIAEAGGLDLIVLGIGQNGHVAFNEPGSRSNAGARRVQLSETSREPYADLFGSLAATPAYGLTLGLAEIRAARRVLLLADGTGKAQIVARALKGPMTDEVPASVLRSHVDLTILLDQPAAALLASR